MYCRKPYVKGGHAFGCGQCVPCRINKRRLWAHRIMLEAVLHEENSFITLTYNDESLPEGNTVVPRHLMLFMKRLRKSLDPKKVRFFGVGEYGEKSNRAHYHLALFGYGPCRKTRTERKRNSCCEVCDRLQELWPYGTVYVGTIEEGSAEYIARYVCKKMTRPDDERLLGRHPEFTRMSLKPGIGAGFMDEVASTLMEHGLDVLLPDVPAVLGHGKKKRPIGAYLRRQLRRKIGKSEKAPPSTLMEMEEKLRPLREAAYANTPKGQSKEFAFKGAIIDAGKGRRIQIESRYQRSKQKDVL